jgi:hypothetical protein
VVELDGLPLALSTAGAYLEHVTTSFAEYHHMYKASWLELQMSSPQVTSYEDRSLYTTWQLSLDQIRQEDKSAAKLLKLWAYFNRQDVWYELLHGGRSYEWLKRVIKDKLVFDRMMRLLCSYGLVDLGSSERNAIGSAGYSVQLRACMDGACGEPRVGRGAGKNSVQLCRIDHPWYRCEMWMTGGFCRSGCFRMWSDAASLWWMAE